jgi:hypothetical protein
MQVCVCVCVCVCVYIYIYIYIYIFQMHVVCSIDNIYSYFKCMLCVLLTVTSNVYLWKCKSIIHSCKYDHTAESDSSVLCFIKHSPHLTMLQIIAIYWNLYEKLRKVLLDFYLWAYIIGCIWLLKLKFNFSDPFSDWTLPNLIKIREENSDVKRVERTMVTFQLWI